jgi:hypothetical protein
MSRAIGQPPRTFSRALPESRAGALRLLVGLATMNGKANSWHRYGDAGIATLEIGAIIDDDVPALSEGNHAIAIILRADHPARGIAQNLFICRA